MAFLLKYLRHMVVPGNKSLALALEDVKSIDMIEYLDSLRLNKAEESTKQPYFDRIFDGKVECSTFRHQRQSMIKRKQIVHTSYIDRKANEVKEQMEEHLFRHFAIYGDEGSGKMPFIEILSETFHSDD